MLATIAALLPVLLVIASGYALARTGLITVQQWHGVERLAYYVLFPAVLFRTIANVDFSQFPTLNMGGALLATLLTMALVMLLLRPLLEQHWGIEAVRFTSIFQGTLRWNAMIALALADSLVGSKGVAILGVAMVFMIPMLNVMSILVLSRYASGKPPSARKILLDLVKNPFIMAILAGVLANISGLKLPTALEDTLELFGRAALPIGIICVGAGLDLSSLRKPGPALGAGTFIRPLVMSLVAWLFCLAFGVDGAARSVVIIAFAVPTASNSYLLAKQMGGDAKLMAEIITLQSLIAPLTLPLALVLFG